MLKPVQHDSFTFYFRPNWTIKYIGLCPIAKTLQPQLTRARTLKWVLILIGAQKNTLASASLNGAHGGSLLELFNKILHPVLTSSTEVLLYFEIENFINGLEK